ncbi:MAG: signal peptidase I [Bacilli bacterium]|nr:signal peptidase I [Bacilli bacterium]
MKKEKMKSVIKEASSYIIIIAIVLVIKHFYVAPIKVNGSSMYNTLKDKDIMILNRFKYRHSDIKRYDIVVVDQGKEYLIKRIIGLPGDELEYKDNILYINGKKVDDKYAKGKTEDFKIKLKKDYYFVMGDNRQNSLDSRYFGPFNRNKIKGKTSFTVFPFSRFGNKK